MANEPLFLKKIGAHEVFVTEEGTFIADAGGETLRARILPALEARLRKLPTGVPLLVIGPAVGQRRRVLCYGTLRRGHPAHKVTYLRTDAGLLKVEGVKLAVPDEAAEKRLAEIARRHAEVELEWRSEVGALPKAALPEAPPKPTTRPYGKRVQAVA